MQGVGGQLGRVALGGDQAAERGGHVFGRDARRVQQRPVLDQLDDGAAGGADGAAALGVEAGLRDAVALHSNRHAHEVTAGGAARGAGVRPVRERAEPARRGQVVLEVHPVAD